MTPGYRGFSRLLPSLPRGSVVWGRLARLALFAGFSRKSSAAVERRPLRSLTSPFSLRPASGGTPGLCGVPGRLIRYWIDYLLPPAELPPIRLSGCSCGSLGPERDRPPRRLTTSCRHRGPPGSAAPPDPRSFGAAAWHSAKGCIPQAQTENHGPARRFTFKPGGVSQF
jgi:hypothetical protein